MSNFDFEFDFQSCETKKTFDFATPSTRDSTRTHFFPEQPHSQESFISLFGEGKPEEKPSCEKTALPSLNENEAPLLVNSKQVKAIKKLRAKREQQLKRMGLALNQENYRLLTSPKREKNSNRSQQAKNIKRNNDGVFVKSKNAIEKTEWKINTKHL